MVVGVVGLQGTRLRGCVVGLQVSSKVATKLLVALLDNL